MESTLRAVVRCGRLPAAGLLFVVALIVWWGSATVAQTPATAPRPEEKQSPASLGTDVGNVLPDTGVSPATPGGEGSPAAAPGTEARPSLAELMQSIARYERAYWPFRMRTLEKYSFAPTVPEEVRNRYPWGDGRHHEYVVTSEQTSPLDWTRTELRIADGMHIGTERKVCGPDGLRVTLELDRTETSAVKHGENPPRFLAASPLLGVFPLQMTRPSDGILLSKYYAQDPSRVTLDWEGVYARLSFTFGPDADHSSRYELWLTPVGAWHPFKLRWYVHAEDQEFEKEWEATAFLQTPSTRIRRGTIQCRDRAPGAPESPHRPIAYSIHFHVEESSYGTSAQRPLNADVSAAAPTDSPVGGPVPTAPGSVEVAPQVSPLPGFAEGLAPGASNPVVNPSTGTPRDALPPAVGAIEIAPDADRSEVVRGALKTLLKSGAKVVAADPRPDSVPATATALVGVREDADGPEIVQVVRTLLKFRIFRISLSMTQAKNSTVVVVAPADMTWRTVHDLLEELKKHAGFEVAVREAGSNEQQQTPPVPLDQPLPISPLPDGPPSAGLLSPLPIAPSVSPASQPGILPPGLEPPADPLAPPTAAGPPVGPLPPLDAVPQTPGPTGLPPQPEPSLDLGLPAPAGSRRGEVLPSLEPPPTSAGPGPSPGGLPTARPGTGSPALNDPHFGGPSKSPSLKVFTLRQALATDVGRIAQQLYGARINLAIDERTNSLLVTDSDSGVLADLEQLLQALDIPERRVGPGVTANDAAFDPMIPPTDPPRNDPPTIPGRTAPSRSADPMALPAAGAVPRPRLAFDETALPADVWALLDRLLGPVRPDDRLGPGRAGAGAGAERSDPSVVRSWNVQAEGRALQLANELRSVRQELREPRKVKELRDLVQLQFHLRQLQQRIELAEFARRLERIGESIETRERIADRIVDRRLEELLDPALTWSPPKPGDWLPAPNPSPPVAPRGDAANDSLLPGSEPFGAGLRRSPNDLPGPNEFRSETKSPGFNPFGGSSSRNDRRSDGAPTEQSPFQDPGKPSLPTSDSVRPSPAPSVDEPAWANLPGTWKIDIWRDGLRDALAGCDDRQAEFEIHGNVLALRFRKEGRDTALPLRLMFPSAERPRQVEVVLNSDGTHFRTLGALSCDGTKLQLCFGRPDNPNHPREIAPAENVTYFEAHRTGFDLPQSAGPVSASPTILQRRDDGTVDVSLGTGQGIRPGDRLKVFAGKAELGELEVTGAKEDQCSARVLSEGESMPIRTGDRVAKVSSVGGREPGPPQGDFSRPRSSAGAKPSVGVQFDLGKPAGEFLWIEGRGGLTSSGAGKTIQASCGSRLRLRLRGLPKHEEENVFLTIEVQDEKSLEAAKVIETVATNSLPLRITDEDLDQVFSNNLVTKVVYLPRDLTKTGESLFETVVSSKLEPGTDPRAEAEKRGTVVAMIRMSRSDEAPAAERRELPSRKTSAASGADAEMQTIPDLSQPPKTDAEKGVARVVLVFAKNETRRGLPVLLVNVGGKTLAMVATPATIVPDGTNPTLDRAFLEIPDRPPVAVTYNPKWQDPKREFYVFECAEELPGQPLEVPPDLDIGEALSAILPGSESEFRVTPEAARIRAVNSSTIWQVPTTHEVREHTGLWELDRVLPEGTLLFRSGQLAGVTLLGTRFLGDKADKSYVVPAQRITELRARLAAIAEKESGGTPAAPPAETPLDPASARPR